MPGPSFLRPRGLASAGGRIRDLPNKAAMPPPILVTLNGRAPRSPNQWTGSQACVWGCGLIFPPDRPRISQGRRRTSLGKLGEKPSCSEWGGHDSLLMLSPGLAARVTRRIGSHVPQHLPSSLGPHGHILRQNCGLGSACATQASVLLWASQQPGDR